MADQNKQANGLLTLSLRVVKKIFVQKLQAVFYHARESIGEPKRTIVVAQVEQACLSLQDTRDGFADALERFNSLVSTPDAALEHKYQLLNRQYQFCRAKSEVVSQRIRALEEVSEALFMEWEKELDDYSNRSLRSNSKQQLKMARQHYAKLIKAMHKAESKIHPVLAAFRDQVLYLKHNLNARAIAALQQEFVGIGLDISQLLQAMEHIIAEANQFVSALSHQPATVQKALPGR
ncbi:MAG: DUF2959 domain-containing protein [Methylovulum sp.]|uniref:DUF2959 domain-containing protein n=1 Tax=Methylovulum sp. TaxID=1916980 RepID=UPI0026322ECC|nr:DUF2959 domain-containing protein [Methylovulum sp.]MDD2724066.1 DUF2959 domain-containing protein [Methylovulum sp.]MDD5123828.1 DUF2959 domain-containing protein [Methylovulum sp.]